MTCSICQHGTAIDFHKTIMGGPPGAICWFCFDAWYELNLVTDEAIRRESIRARHDPKSLRYEGVTE